MDRFIRRYSWVFAVCATLGVVAAATGCRSAIATMLFVFKGNNVEADFKGLEKKKVAVVIRPTAEMQCRNPGAARELAKRLSKKLADNVNKIKIVDQQKVEKWCDENNWEEYPEVGKAVKAEMVVGVDLESFSIYQGQTIYQGRASCSVRVYDVKDDGKVVFERNMPQTIYPPSAGVAASEMPETEFRLQFVDVLAEQIGRYFYPHDGHADIGQDSRILR